MSKRNSSSYTEEFRQSSAKLAYESNQSVSTTADNLGVHETTLYGWIAKYYPNRSKRQKLDQGIDPYEELKQLKKDLKRVTMERDILKKAAAYFAGETL
jgi:transposase